MPPQVYDWTCSACSLDWVIRAAGLGHTPWSYPASRYTTVLQIGCPDNINSQYGLMDGSGAELQRVLQDYGQSSDHDWLDFDAVYTLAQTTTGLMSGANWYHWVALRGIDGPNLWIANSAPNYKGVDSILSREDFQRLGGFSVIWLT